MITIITAVFNEEKNLPKLFESLRSQTTKEFLWVVADGGSSDGTLDLLEKNKDLVTKVVNGPDFGIYDGLNKAIKEIDTKYYLTIGADDYLYPDAIEQFNYAIKSSRADFISAYVKTSDGELLVPKRGNVFRYGHLGYISQHSVGTLINKELHSTVGLYSRKFPIAADRYFILDAIENFEASIEVINHVVGIYSKKGVSSEHFYEALLDIFKVDYILSKSPLLTALKSCIRYMINIHKMARR